MNKIIRVDASSNVWRERTDLIASAMIGIKEVTDLQGSNATVITGGMNKAQKLSSYEIPALGMRNNQLMLDVDKYALNMANNDHSVVGPNVDYVLTDRDMFAQENNFIYGVAYHKWQLSIQSINRYVKATRDVDMQRKLVAHTARHEYGHLAGLKSPEDYINPDMRPDPYTGHCLNVCTMAQTITDNETMKLVEKLNGRGLSGFCAHCVAKLRQKAK